MAYVAFFTDQYLKDNSIVNANVDPQLLRPTIRMCQEQYILPLLGTALYNKMIGLISGAPTVTLTGNYGVLLSDYIQPTLLWYTISESTLPLSYRMTNNNIVRKNSQNSTSAELNEILQIKDYAKDKGQWYAERLHRYLLANTDLFPEYVNPGTTIDTIIPRRFVFSDGIGLGKYPTKTGLKKSGEGKLIIEIGKNDWLQ